MNLAEIDQKFDFVSRETYEQLKTYVALLLRWQSSINLISPNTVDDVWQRHIDDSLQLYPLLPNPCHHLVDLGSGAGLPGLVLAILGVERVTLIESDTRKSAFLRTVCRELELENVSVINERIEDVLSLKVDCLTARALAPLDKLFEISLPLVKNSGTLLFPKGRNYQQEIDEAAGIIPDQATCEIIKSTTSPDSVILKYSL